jgi:hypothetical protein
MRFLRAILGNASKQAAASDSDHADSDHMMVSLVVLYDAYIELDLDALRQALDDVFPGEFLPPREQGSFVVDGTVPGATFMIKSAVQGAAGLFMLNNVPGPYTEFSDFADYINDPALRERAEALSCWLSIDLIHEIEDIEGAYRFIGKAIARLAPADSAFLVHPETYHHLVFNEDVRGRLADGRRLFAIR